jgi:sodium-coupled neutral amino acid transporter 11
MSFSRCSIGIPYAISNSGLVVGVLLLILVSYLTDKSLRILIELANYHPKLKNLGVHTFEDLMSIPFGRHGTLFVLVNMFILAYGAMVAYLIIIKDTVVSPSWQQTTPAIISILYLTLRMLYSDIQPVALDLTDDPGNGDFWNTEFVMFVTSLIIVVPLSMQRDMANLAFTSSLSVSADVVLVILVVAFSPISSSVEEAGGFFKVLGENWINSRVFVGLGVLSTAMACQHSAFIVSGSLDNRTPERWGIVTFRSLATSCLLCLLLGTTGYLGFLDETRGDILNNFDEDSKTANGGRILLAITMFFTYPMEAFVARHVVVQMFFGGDMDGPNPDSWFNRRVMITLAIYVATLIPAFFVDDLGPVLALTGSLGASCLSYIAVGLVYLGVNGEDFLAHLADCLRGKGSSEVAKNGEVELPVVGDAAARMQPATAAAAADLSPLQGRKPWWWWMGGYPIWVAIASTGAHGTRNFLTNFHAEAGQSMNSYDESEVILPQQRDYYISMFFIAFGVLAAVVGVTTVVYVEINDVFFTAH